MSKINKDDIALIEKIASTLLEWSGEPPDASEDEVMVEAVLSHNDIIYGDMIKLADLAIKLRHLVNDSEN